MRPSLLGRVISATLTIAGVALTSLTAGLVMLHAMVAKPGSSSALPAPSSGQSFAPLPTATPHQAVSPRPRATAQPSPVPASTRTVAGPTVDEPFGQVQATLTLTGSKITNVSISAPQDNPRSAMINQQAVPMLQSETLQAQSANIDAISGATITSEAYIQSLQGALQSAGL